MSSPSVKGAELGLTVECVAVVVGEVEHAVMVDDSGDVSELWFPIFPGIKMKILWKVFLMLKLLLLEKLRKVLSLNFF